MAEELARALRPERYGVPAAHEHFMELGVVLGDDRFVVLDPGHEPELGGATNVAARALLERFHHPGFVARVELGAVGGHRLRAKAEGLHRAGVEVATQQLDMMDAVAALEERHQGADDLVGRHAGRIEHRSHGGGGAVQPQQADPHQQAGNRPDDLVVSLEHEIQRRPVAARLEPLDPGALMDDAAVGEARDEPVPIAVFSRRGRPNGHHDGFRHVASTTCSRRAE